MEEKNKSGSTEALSGTLKTRHVVMLSLGGAIGAGLFLGSGSAILAAGPAVIVSYLLSGLILYILLLGVSKIVIHQKEKSVGMSGLISPIIGKRLGHFTDWMYWIVSMSVVIAEAAAISQFLAPVFPTVPAWVWYIVAAALTFLLNMVSVRAFAESEYWLAWIKIAVIILLILFGIILLGTQVFHLGLGQGLAKMSNYGGFAPTGIGGILGSMLIVLYSYGGSELVAITVSETENPREAIPKAVRGVIGRIAIFYVVPIFLFVELYSWKELSQSKESPFVSIFNHFHVPFAGAVVQVVIIIALFSVLNSMVYGTSRSFYARVAQSDHSLGKFFAKLSSKQVPVRSLTFSVALLIIGAILSLYFSNMFVVMASSISLILTIVWLMLLIAGIVYYFKNPEVAGWGLKISSIIALLALLAVGVGTVIQTATAPGTPVLFIFGYTIVVILVSFLSYGFRRK